MGSFGENLRRERELRGVSLREIADGTKISLRFLQALEEDRVDVLPGGLFPRAFVKQYALFLGLDVDKAVADFVTAHAEAPPERKVYSDPPRRSPVSLGQAFLAVVAVLAVALTFRRGGERERARPEPTPTPVVAAPAVLPTDRVYPSPSLAPTSAATGDSLVLTMTAEQDCWVEVRADGETVINRVLAEGESQTLEARGEIVLSVGNAGGLSIRVNDRPALPLGRSGEVRKNIVITRQNLPSLVEQDGAVAPRRSQRLAPMAEARATNPLVEQFRRGGVARDLRLMAAQGLLPLKPEDLVEMWTDLVQDPDEGVRAAADKSLSSFPAAELQPILKSRDTPAERAVLGRHPPPRARAARGRAAEHLAARRDDRGARSRADAGARGARGHQPDAPPAAHVPPRGAREQRRPQQRPEAAPARAAGLLPDRAGGGRAAPRPRGPAHAAGGPSRSPSRSPRSHPSATSS